MSEASDGFEALASAEWDAPHVLVTDFELPVMGGFELCEELHASPATRDVPLIVVTRLATESVAFRYLADDLGATFLTKPIPETILSRAVDHVLRNSVRLRDLSSAARRRARVLRRRSATVIAHATALQHSARRLTRWDALLERMVTDFIELPALAVTLEQAAGRWDVSLSLAALSCEYLRRRGLLVRDGNRFVRAGDHEPSGQPVANTGRALDLDILGVLPRLPDDGVQTCPD